MLLSVALCLRLGMWQHDKAVAKQALQDQLNQRMRQPPVMLPEVDALGDPAAWRYRRVKVRGTFDARHQILLDNQVHDGVAGYYVITPLQVEGRPAWILVNRGWVAAPVERSRLPVVPAPSGMHDILGDLWLPPAKNFTLQRMQAQVPWQIVWQNLDVARYARAVGKAVYPLVLRMDPAQPNGYVRDWPKPAERIEMHLGYAYQWFGFAVAILLIYVVVNVRAQAH